METHYYPPQYLGGGTDVHLPGFTPGGPNDPQTGGDGYMGDTNTDDAVTQRQNPPNTVEIESNSQPTTTSSDSTSSTTVSSSIDPRMVVVALALVALLASR